MVNNKYFIILLLFIAHLNIFAEEKPVLELKAYLDGPPTIYPGQHFKLMYRFSYKGSISLNKEFLPMLDAKEFRKIGSKEIREGQVDDLSIQDISQEYIAKKPGVYTFPDSYIEGDVFRNESGNNIVTGQMKSEVPSQHVTISDFPSKNQPESFNGAIGNFTFEIEPLFKNTSVLIGDVLKLNMMITGKELDTAYLPDILCQPGFSGLFQIEEQSKIGVVEGSSKIFTLNLQIISGLVEEIPSIEFSYFDPKSDKYTTLKNDPIPLKIKQKQEAVALNSKENEVNLLLDINKDALSKIKTLPEIDGIYLINAMDNFSFKPTFKGIFCFILAGLFLTQFQYDFKKYLKIRKTTKVLKAKELFLEAQYTKFGTPEFFNKLEKAFILRLFEIGEINSPSIDITDLPKTIKSNKVDLFFTKLDEMRYSEEKKLDKSIIKEAKKLFDHL